MAKKINSKAKGKRGELEFSHLCKAIGFDTRRSQQYAGINNDADVIGIPGLHLEVKRVERLNLSEAINQATRDAAEGEIPIVAHRRDREDWKITLAANTFLEIYKYYLEEGKE